MRRHRKSKPDPSLSRFEIRHEDEDLIVVNKPAGMVVHPAPGSSRGTLVNALCCIILAAACRGSVGPNGRASCIGSTRNTSGLLVVAKSDRAHHGLAAQFAAHSVDRVYQAVCYGVPDAGDPTPARDLGGVSFEPGEHPQDHHAIGAAQNGSATSGGSVLGRAPCGHAGDARRIASERRLARLSCWLETGRTHQIRVHLAHVGHALLGDPVYGRRRKASQRGRSEEDLAARLDGFSRQALHAARLGFVHPVSGETLSFEAALPRDMADTPRRAGPIFQRNM